MSPITQLGIRRGVGPESLTGIRRLILDLSRARRLTLADLSRGVGRNHSYFHQFLYRKTPTVLPEDVRHELARILDLEEARLRQDRQNPEELAEVPADAVKGPSTSDYNGVDLPGSEQSAPPTPERIPVFLDTDAIVSASASEWSAWPGPVTGPLAGAFGVYVSRNRGRFKPSDLVFARPRVPPREGDAVIGVRGTAIDVIGDLVQLGPDSAAIQDGPGAPKTVRLDGLRLLKVTVALFA